MTLPPKVLPHAVLITLDVDWAPDWMIEEVAQRLIKARVRATFFATHESSATRALEREPLFEVGVHPNFLPGSSHGNTPEEALRTMRTMFPHASAVRTHSLAQSEPALGMMADKFGFKIDCSIHLPRALHVAPHWVRYASGGNCLVRVPHVFQDNMHALAGKPWDLTADWFAGPGWKVMNFHPVHIILNSANPEAYERLKSRRPVSKLARSDIPDIDGERPGTGRLFDDLLTRLSTMQSYSVSERVALWQEAGE
jgi:hypothetical protein